MTNILQKLRGIDWSSPNTWLVIYSWNSLTMIVGKIGLLQMVLAYPKQQSIIAILMTLFNNSLYLMVTTTSKSKSGITLTLPFIFLDVFFLIYIFTH